MVAHQRSLFATGDPAIDVDARIERLALDDRSWVDIGRNWLRGADTLLDALVEGVEWHQGRRRMWDRVLDDPRLSCWFRDGDPLPDPSFTVIRAALTERYSKRFVTVGARRPFLLRPKKRDEAGRRRSIDLAPASGDLIVMGGACQRGWEHGVP